MIENIVVIVEFAFENFGNFQKTHSKLIEKPIKMGNEAIVNLK